MTEEKRKCVGRNRGWPSLKRIHLGVEGGVVELTLNRPDTKNEFDLPLVEELTKAVRWCADLDDLRVLVITGAGGAFSVGGALTALRRGAADLSQLEPVMGSLVSELSRSILAIRRLPCPVVAAVDGRAGGAGVSLALACDLRIASDRVVFDFAYARIGATPDGGMTWFLPRLLGEARALELLIESPIVRADWALDLGLVSAVVPSNELAKYVRTLVNRVSKHPTHYVGEVKGLVGSAAQADLGAHLETERTVLLESLRRDESRTRILDL